MSSACYIIFGYAFLNFLLVVLTLNRLPSHEAFSPLGIRLITGHSMLYAVAFTTLYSVVAMPQLPRTRKVYQRPHCHWERSLLPDVWR